MQSLSTARAIEGVGLQAVDDGELGDWLDRYAKRAGAWSKSEAPGGARDVALVGMEAIRAACAAVGDESLTEQEMAMLTRRGIAVDGFGPVLEGLIGQTLVTDEGVELAITGNCKPCDRPGHLAAKLGRPGLDFRELFSDGRGGVRARVQNPGILAVGYSLTIT